MKMAMVMKVIKVLIMKTVKMEARCLLVAELDLARHAESFVLEIPTNAKSRVRE